MRSARRIRYERRSTSAVWLIGQAREAAGLPRDSGPEAGGWVRPLRPARCSWRIAEGVGVHLTEGRPAHWSGVERCGSIWACPVCSAVIRHERSLEVQLAADRWTELGNSVLMVTLTSRHYRGDALAVTLDQALKAWRRLMRDRGWRALVKRLGVVGYVRAVEVTWGGVNGWHPHIHALLLVEGRPTDEEIATLEREVFALWRASLLACGGRSVIRKRGVRVSRATSAEYVTKVQEHDRAGVEMARLDLKRGRSGSLMPFELLDSAANRQRWLEYVDATWRRRAITWSQGLKDLLSIGERTDEEVMAEVEASDLVAILDGATYDGLRRDALRLVGVLENVEDGRDPLGGSVTGWEARK